MKINVLNFKKVILIIFILAANISCNTYKTNNSLKKSIKEKLNVPFGTLVKLKIEIIDGKSLNKKGQSDYLIKVLEINDFKPKNPFIMKFEDRTGKFPNNDFSLYKFLYGKEANGGLSSDKIEEINKDYIGKEFYVLAYESGCFSGNTKVSKYVQENTNTFLLMRQDTSFSFKNYIVIESKINE